MIPEYLIALSVAMFAVGISGIAASRHFLIIVLSAEAMLLSSTLLAVTFFYYSVDGSIAPLLLVLWSAAAAETIALVAIYRFLERWEVSMDVSKLSRLRH